VERFWGWHDEATGDPGTTLADHQWKGVRMSARAASASRESTSQRLQAARDGLSSMTGTSESEIETLARTFQKLADETSRILGLASKIVECIEDDTVMSLLPTLRALGIAETGLIESRLQATHGILEASGSEMNVLRQLSKVTRSQSGIALKTRILAMMTNVEVGRLGSLGTSFEYLASELNNFSKTLSADTDDLEHHTGNRRTAIEATNRVLVAELPRLADDLTRIKIKLEADLAVLESGLVRLGSIPRQFKSCVENIGAQIRRAVAAIQSYDITRQQIDHVHQAIGDIAEEVPVGGGRRKGSLRGRSRFSLGITIQVYQLRQIRETVVNWISQVRDCLEAMLRISASDMASISPMVRARENEVSTRLDHIELMRSESKAYSGSVCRTVGEHSSLVNLIDEQVKKAAVTRQTLHLLSLNAIVEGDRLGAQANAVLEIGNGISDLTLEWSRITDQSDLAMQAISELVERINNLTANFSETEDQKLQQVQAQARAGLNRLREASDFAARQSRDIQLGLESMKIMTSGIVKSVDVLEASNRQIDGVLSVLQSVQCEFEADPSETWDEDEAEEMRQHFSASYTTEIEREVLRIALGGTALPPTGQPPEGNGVELF
jgi:hypothetical protein